LKIILYNPEIPQNTGNIIRTCSVTNTNLILVKPYGFSMSNRMLKRSGLDYFKNIQIEEIDNLDTYLENCGLPFYFFSSKASKLYTSVIYSDDCLLIFGSETSGLPHNLKEKYPDSFITVPMKSEARCLNLSNTVAIAIYEAKRQQSFIF
jgi:tRNA (cytidine/uridine-2'-O-)-methyltransferase